MSVTRAASAARLAVLMMVAGAALAGCESSRFTGRGPTVAARTPPALDAPEPTVSALPSAPVTSEPLPPPPGSAGPGPVADVPVLPGSPQPVETLGGPPGSSAPAAPPPASRSAVIGGWTARDASGAGCRVNLTSTPSLDLYRANAGGCPNRDLARITAWDFRDGEVYLYQPGGAVAARLRSSEGALSGVLAKSGAPLTLTRS